MCVNIHTSSNSGQARAYSSCEKSGDSRPTAYVSWTPQAWKSSTLIHSHTAPSKCDSTLFLIALSRKITWLFVTLIKVRPPNKWDNLVCVALSNFFSKMLTTKYHETCQWTDILLCECNKHISRFNFPRKGKCYKHIKHVKTYASTSCTYTEEFFRSKCQTALIVLSYPSISSICLWSNPANISQVWRRLLHLHQGDCTSHS